MSKHAINLFMFLSLLLAGCTDLFDGFDLDQDLRGDVRAVYVKEHPWIGKCAKFESQMIYVTNLPTSFDHTEVLRVGRALLSAGDADDLRRNEQNIGPGFVITPVPTGTTFTVTAVFTYEYSGLARLVGEKKYDVAVLRDSHGHVSTQDVPSLKPCL